MANLTLGIYVLPKIIKPFHDAYPDLKIEMFLDKYGAYYLCREARQCKFRVYRDTPQKNL